MFTGIIEIRGEVVRIIPEPPGVRLVVGAGSVADGVNLGDSVAVNGCCLTVVGRNGDRLEFQAGEETLSRTNLGRLAEGTAVNLERSLRAGGRLDGHLVTGHIDGVGLVVRREDHGDWSNLWFSAPESLARQMASKGSIAVDGVSLTLVDVESERFSVALIPHTLQVTTLGLRRIGDEVNLETDVLAKYVQRQLEAWRDKP